jgi:5'-deoxynucleotidase YfbR-like HD superfamily hydrolase
MNEIKLSKIDHITHPFLKREAVEFQTNEPIASTILRLGDVAMRFARIDRVPRYADSAYESDAEHSFMLGLVATELAHRLYPTTLNSGKVTQYTMVHDLIELKTYDVATFLLNSEQLKEKERVEQEALPELLEELPPFISELLKAYEEQADVESRFVRAVDKALPVTVDILGDGITMMKEDYNVTSMEQLIESHANLCSRIATKYAEFPEVVAAQRLLCDLLEEELIGAFDETA